MSDNEAQGATATTARPCAEMRTELDAAVARDPFDAVATALSFWLRQVTPPAYMNDRSGQP
jgi:hypothetical protein